ASARWRRQRRLVPRIWLPLVLGELAGTIGGLVVERLLPIRFLLLDRAGRDRRALRGRARPARDVRIPGVVVVHALLCHWSLLAPPLAARRVPAVADHD